MNTLELKGSLLQLIANSNDENFLQEVYDILIDKIHQQHKGTDWWTELSSIQQYELDEAIDESYDENEWVSDNDARQNIQQWLNK